MYFSKAQRLVLSSSLSVFLAGCGAPNYAPSEMHMSAEEVQSEAPQSPDAIPALVKATPTVPVMSNEKGADTFDVVVTNVPVRDLLFALARDSGVNMDIDADVGGLVTMSALDQTLDAILDR
ncbi:MAG: type II and III secretion system protein, partial [Gammaproteobacteria bacterium]